MTVYTYYKQDHLWLCDSVWDVLWTRWRSYQFV